MHKTIVGHNMIQSIHEFSLQRLILYMCVGEAERSVKMAVIVTHVIQSVYDFSFQRLLLSMWVGEAGRCVDQLPGLYSLVKILSNNIGMCLRF